MIKSFTQCVLKWVRLLTTSRDNQTPDVIRIGAIIIITQFVLQSAYSLFGLGNAFQPELYGLGAGGVLAAAGAAIRMKKDDEPEPEVTR